MLDGEKRGGLVCIPFVPVDDDFITFTANRRLDVRRIRRRNYAPNILFSIQVVAPVNLGWTHHLVRSC